MRQEQNHPVAAPARPAEEKLCNFNNFSVFAYPARWLAGNVYVMPRWKTEKDMIALGANLFRRK
jgi:hypothetical protein